MPRPASTPSRGSSRRAAPPPPAEVRVTRLGADGDGLAALPDGTRLFLADALPGELVLAAPMQPAGGGWAARVEAVLEPSPDRVPPPCRLFPDCGGCTLQHASDAAVATWKAAQLTDALRRAGFPDPAVTAAPPTPPLARRRMDLAIRRVGRAVVIGLHRRRAGDVVDMTTCQVLHPALFALVQPLRTALLRLRGLRREGAAVVNLLDSGPDLLLRTDAAPDAADRTLLAALAEQCGLPRIAWAPLKAPVAEAETVAQLRPATTTLSGTTVAPPPGAFLQASAAGEQAIVAAVLAALPERLPPRARIVELHAGCGTLSLALMQHARVEAYETDAAACRTLRQAAGGRIAVTQRDLVRQPLLARDLTGVAAVVLDPPWAGVGPQMAELAASQVRRVAYVSCNPQALSRDAAVLASAGWSLLGASVIDQFRWSARVEGVAVFSK